MFPSRTCLDGLLETSAALVGAAEALTTLETGFCFLSDGSTFLKPEVTPSPRFNSANNLLVSGLAAGAAAGAGAGAAAGVETNYIIHIDYLIH